MRNKSCLGASLIIAASILFSGNRLYQGQVFQALSGLNVMPNSVELEPMSIIIYIISFLFLCFGLWLSLKTKH